MKSNIIDTVTSKCYKLEKLNSELAVKFIQNNQLDSLDSLYKSLPIECNEFAWNNLIKVLLISTKYPEQIDSIDETQMDFIVEYITCVKTKNFIYNKGENHEYFFNQMPTFLKLHNAAQLYLLDLYNMLSVDSKQFQLVGNLIGKHNLFFDNLNDSKNYFYSDSNLSFQSLASKKNKIKNDVLTFFSLKSSFAFNEQLGNSIQCDYFSIEIIKKQSILGFNLFGLGFNTTNANYEVFYNGMKINPNTKVNYGFHYWYNYMFSKKSFIKPFAGAGLGFQFRQFSASKGIDDVTLEISTFQIYPEVGFLIGKWPNYFLKVHGSYHLSSYSTSYKGEFTDIGESTFSDNLSQNDWRIGITLLIGSNPEIRQKARIVGLR